MAGPIATQRKSSRPDGLRLPGADMKPARGSTIAARFFAWAFALYAVVLVTDPGDARAQTFEEPEARALTGALKRIKDSGAVRIGYRERAIPFSFEGSDRRPYGYSIDLCAAIVEGIAREVGVALLRTEYRQVTPADRIELLVAGRIDLECGATTNTAQRREQVAFSPSIFVGGTRLLVRRGSPIRSLRELDGRQVVVVRATTNESVMRQLASTLGRSFTVNVTDDYAQALAKLSAGEVDALAADDILIAGLLTEQKLRAQYSMVGELLSYDPYGIIFARGDAPMASVVDATFRRLAATRELRWIYDKWFLRSLPSGVRLGLPMSVQLERSFQLLGLPAD
jgi:ABC-type amino acid transport substrate-binding protein